MEYINEIAGLIIVIFTALTGILTFIEKCTAIKWKPLSKIFQNKEINEKLDKITEQQKEFAAKLNSIEDINDVREMKRLKANILNFANEKCTQGIKKDQEQETAFDEWVNDYEALIKKHNLTNGHTFNAVQLVSDYRKMELQDKYKKNVKVDKRKKNVV